jgi:hypothetical protein
MNNYQTWLETANIVRIAIVQAQAIVSGTLTTRYLSTHGVTVDSVQYLPIIKGSVTVDESISTTYSASISYGDIELANTTGEYDSWLNDVWANKSVKIYVGTLPTGTGAVIGDFELVFDGITEDIDSKSRNQLNLKIRDKLEKLNTSISEALLGNYNPRSLSPYTNQYEKNLKPIVFGEVHNITPLLTEPVLLEYMVNTEAVEQIIEVRDNGVPVLFTQTGGTYTIPSGSFRLLNSPVGAVTCSVQGTKRTVNIAGATFAATYTNTVSNTIATILKFYGQQLAYTELNAASFATLGTDAVGVYVSDRVNVLQLCQDIAKGSGLVVATTRSGQVKLIDLDIPKPPEVTITINETDTLLNSLQISQKPQVIAGVKLGYAKNWTIQNTLQTAIPQQHKDLYATEWLESSQVDPDVKTNYAVTVEPALESTYLIDKTQADAAALKKLNLFKTPRRVYTMTCTAKFLNVQIGDGVTLVAPRFGLTNGVLGRVVSSKPNWLRGTIEIGVLA